MLESALLVTSLCIDACLASFAYGTNKIKIPLGSSIILTGISTLFLYISVSLGRLIQSFIPPSLTSSICFSILGILGILRLFEGLAKNYLNKKAVSPSQTEWTLFNFKLVLSVYADATLADLDHSKSLSSKEALYLGIALSLDSLVVGLGAGLSSLNLIEVLIFSIIFNLIAILGGAKLGKKCAEALPIDFSWLSGFLLILLAIIKVI